MGIALVANTAVQSSTGLGVTSPSFDSTGATLVTAILSSFGHSSASDSKGNSPSALTQQGIPGAEGCVVIVYFENPIVGSGHTVSGGYVGGPDYQAVAAQAWSGAATSGVFDQQNGADSSGAVPSLAAGPVTPTTPGQLILFGAGWDPHPVGSVTAGATLLYDADVSPAIAFGIAAAYQIQVSASTINLAYTDAGGGSGGLVAVVATFKAGGGGSAGASAGSSPVAGIGKALAASVGASYGGRRNRFDDTVAFDRSAWTKTALSVTADAHTAPDGSLTADKLVEDGTFSVHGVTQTLTLQANTSYSISISALQAEKSKVWLNCDDLSGTPQTAYFNLAAGTIQGAPIGSNCSITAEGGGWYRCSMQFNSGTGSSPGNQSFGPTTSGIANVYTGTPGEGIYVANAQFERGEATPYQPNTVAAVAVAAELGVGSSSGSAAAAAVGAARAAGLGAAAGVAAAAAASGGSSNGVGAAVGAAGAAAIGAATAAAMGSSAGVGAAAGVGAETAAEVGDSGGSGAASGVSSSTAAGGAASTGSGSALGVGAATAAAVASSSGLASASGVASGAQQSSGNAAGSGPATGVGAALAAGDGASSGMATCSGISSAMAAGIASAAGVASAAWFSAQNASAGSCAGAGTAGAVGLSARTISPSDDVAIGTWLRQPSGAPLADAINEEIPDDANFIYAPYVGTATARFRFPPAPIPVDRSQHRFAYAIKAGTPGQTLTVRLYSGVTLLGEWTHTDESGVFEQTFDGNLVSDYSDLELELIAA